MKIVCIGGGPAGLYFSILMKKADPRHDITVIERNRPDDTFGWGVVFSDATLGNFAQADARQPRRDPAQLPPLGRHRRLLQGRQDHSERSRLLRDRAPEAAQYPAGASRCAGRDAGVRDRGGGRRRVCRRRSHRRGRRREQPDAHESTPSNSSRTSTCASAATSGWARARSSMPSRSRSRRRSGAGFSCTPTASTRIPAPSSSRRAKRPGMRPDWTKRIRQASIAFCERVFAKYLDGHSLMSNARHLRGSAWLNFNRVLCRKWHYRNIVLIGDAAHTAHFSIGVGHQAGHGRCHRAVARALSRATRTSRSALEIVPGGAQRRSAASCRAPRATAWSGSRTSRATCTSIRCSFPTRC